MFSKLFPWAFFFNWMPYPRRFSRFGHGFVRWYRSYYDRYKEATIRYYKNQLRELDHCFKMEEASKELVRLREIAREQGIGPMDPRYPDLDDVM